MRLHHGQDAGHLALGPGRRVEEDVGDREAPVVGGGRVEALGLEAAAPRRPRQVDHQPAPVALAVDAPGAVDHHLERRQRALQHGPARPPVPRRERGEGAGVVLLELREPAGRDRGERGRGGHPRASRSSVRRNMVVDRRAVTVGGLRSGRGRAQGRGRRTGLRESRRLLPEPARAWSRAAAPDVVNVHFGARSGIPCCDGDGPPGDRPLSTTSTRSRAGSWRARRSRWCSTSPSRCWRPWWRSPATTSPARCTPPP